MQLSNLIFCHYNNTANIQHALTVRPSNLENRNRNIPPTNGKTLCLPKLRIYLFGDMVIIINSLGHSLQELESAFMVSFTRKTQNLKGLGKVKIEKLKKLNNKQLIILHSPPNKTRVLRR
jgi:hypothetical protein